MALTQPRETPSGRNMQELSRIAEKRPSTSENEISEKRRRAQDENLPVDLARVKTEVTNTPRTVVCHSNLEFVNLNSAKLGVPLHSL